MNVLIIAYACEPNKTSEPGVGWNFVKEISSFANVTVVTRLNNKINISSENIKGVNFLYFDMPFLFQKIKKKLPFSIPIYYSLWNKGVYKFIERKKIISKNNFDLVHHLTFGTTKNIPCFEKINLPFIWGPIGGGDIIPFNFLIRMNLRSILNELIYRSFNQISFVSRRMKYARKFSSAIIFRTNSTFSKFPKSESSKHHIISETAMDLNLFPKNITKKNNEVLTILCVGKLVHSKGYMLALKGFKTFLELGGKGKLIFYGEGSDENTFKKYAKKNNLINNVKFMGFRNNVEIKQAMQKSHVLLHPSFREGGSWSILEAMSYGLPVICLDASGPKDMVTNSSGFLIQMTSPTQVSMEIGKTLYHLNCDSNMYSVLSNNSQLRIKSKYSWAIRRKQIKKVYESVLNSNLDVYHNE